MKTGMNETGTQILNNKHNFENYKILSHGLQRHGHLTTQNVTMPSQLANNKNMILVRFHLIRNLCSTFVHQ